MGAESRGRKGKGKGKGNYNRFKKETFKSPNDIPLGPRVLFTSSTLTKPEGDSNSNAKVKQEVNVKSRQSLDHSDKKGTKKFGKKYQQEQVQFNPKSKKSVEEKKEINRLKTAIEKDSPLKPEQISHFKDFPLSKKTLKGLQDSNYEVPTEIQKESVGLALRGMDILGAAKTGSGKTLAFLIPVVEKLYQNLWSKMDGLGALIITPTRELAYQIFETLRNVGRYHEFSAGLIIGGKDLKFERKRMDLLNIVICTPGRLLQHMDENSSFDTTNLQMLVLDEADQCLDMGFEKDMNAIFDHLPTERQTLLFSATQTKSVKDLARLSLKSPVYVSVHENSQYSTPEALQQSYMVCPLESKLDMLWSFLKHHKKSKILVFMSSCKQVRFVHMLFCRMRPGMSLLALHGSMHQLKRMATYDDFSKKQAVVLFATDIAARGLDFPEVDWVIQLDCPETSTTYIHRAGRTARFNKGGEALLVLMPSEEEAMVSQLEQKRIPIEKIEVNAKRMVSVTRKFEALLARDLTLKECAQRAFKSYLKSVYLMKNKEVFDVTKLDLPSFARSLGLAVAPRVRFIQKRKDSQNKIPGQMDSQLETESESEYEQDSLVDPKKSTATFEFNSVDDDEDIDTLLTGKKPAEIDEEDDLDTSFNFNEKSKKVKTKASVAKKLIKKKIQINTKVTFDDEGEVMPNVRKEKRSEAARNYELEDVSGIDIMKAKAVLKEEDQYDKQLFRERIKTRHREARRKAKLARKGLTEDDVEDADDGPRIRGQAQSDDDDDEPNLDWLPDPDKIYGSNLQDESHTDNDELSDESEPNVFDVSRKRQREVVNTDSESEREPEPIVVKKKKPSKNQDKNDKKTPANRFEKEMDMDLMEDLALQLLGNKT